MNPSARPFAHHPSIQFSQTGPSTGPLSALSTNAPAGGPITVAPASSAPAASPPAAAGAVVGTNATNYNAWAQAPSSSAAAGHLAPLAAPSPAHASSSPTVAVTAGSTYPAMNVSQAPASAPATSTPVIAAAAAGDSRAAVYTGHPPAPSPYGGNAALFVAPSPASATSWPVVAAAAGNTAASVNSGHIAAPSPYGAIPYPALSAAPSPASAASSPIVAAAAAAAAAAYTGQVPTPSPFGAAGFPALPPAYSGPSATSSPAAAGAASILQAAVPTPLAPAPASTPLAPAPASTLLATPAPPAPVASPAVMVAAGPGATVSPRVLKPNFDLWVLKDLRHEATRQAGTNTALTYGPLPENVVRQISNARKDELVQALDARLKWREQLAQPPEWTDIPIGTTPEKKKQKREASIAKAKKKAGKKETVESDVQGFCCRMVCLMMQPDFLDLYVKSKGGSTGIARAEQDEGAVGFRHIFYQRLARAMATIQWRDADGRPLSVPDDHAQDDKAPEALKARLASLPDDMERSAVTLHNDLQRFDGDDNAFYLELQRRIFQWVKDVQANHTVSL